MRHNSHNKKVSIAAANAIPSTSTMNFQEPAIYVEGEAPRSPAKPQIPLITVPDFADFNSDAAQRMSRENSVIELQNLEIGYDLQSISSCDSDTVIEVETAAPRLVRTRERVVGRTISPSEHVETCLSVVIEKRDLESVESDEGKKTNYRNENDVMVNETSDVSRKDIVGNESERQRNNSEIVLSPLQLGQ